MGIPVLLTILIVIVTETVALEQACPYNHSVELTNRSYNGVAYDDTQVFYDLEGKERGCQCLVETCGRKCCPFGQIYNISTRLCVDSDKPFTVDLWREHKRDPNAMALAFIIGKQTCDKDKNEWRLAAFPASRLFRLRTVRKTKHNKHYMPNSFVT